jgi:hypothetical protein
VEGYAQNLWSNIQSLNQKLSSQVEDMGSKISKIIEAHEYEYLQAYNIFVKRKENELKEFVEKMDKRHADTKIFD